MGTRLDHFGELRGVASWVFVCACSGAVLAVVEVSAVAIAFVAIAFMAGKRLPMALSSAGVGAHSVSDILRQQMQSTAVAVPDTCAWSSCRLSVNKSCTHAVDTTPTPTFWP